MLGESGLLTASWNAEEPKSEGEKGSKVPTAAHFLGQIPPISANSDLSNAVLDLFGRFLAALGTIRSRFEWKSCTMPPVFYAP
ncbi:MAG: hypothetical protein CMP92_02190 [Gammaproteobacteria bacterium]|nr:hypothetical protein [Gammaproteobacteria bacterium]